MLKHFGAELSLSTESQAIGKSSGPRKHLVGRLLLTCGVLLLTMLGFAGRIHRGPSFVASGEASDATVASAEASDAMKIVLQELGQRDLQSHVQGLTWSEPITGVFVAGLAAHSELHDFVKRTWEISSDAAHRLLRIELLAVPHALQSFRGTFSQTKKFRASPVQAIEHAAKPDNNSSSSFQTGLAKLKEHFILPHGGNANLIFTWHGSSRGAEYSIASAGARSLGATDNGYFGDGTYSALEAWYAAQYSRQGADGECSVILFATVIGSSYVITLENDYGEASFADGSSAPGFSNFWAEDGVQPKTLKRHYQNHFVPVKHCGEMWQGTHLSYNVDYQACPEAESEAHEVVCKDFNYMYPLAVCYFMRP